MMGFPGSATGQESVCNVGDRGLIPGLGSYPGEENSYPLQYSGLENSIQSMQFAKSWTRLSNFHFSLSHNMIGLVPKALEMVAL